MWSAKLLPLLLVVLVAVLLQPAAGAKDVKKPASQKTKSPVVRKLQGAVKKAGTQTQKKAKIVLKKLQPKKNMGAIKAAVKKAQTKPKAAAPAINALAIDKVAAETMEKLNGQKEHEIKQKNEQKFANYLADKMRKEHKDIFKAKGKELSKQNKMTVDALKKHGLAAYFAQHSGKNKAAAKAVKGAGKGAADKAKKAEGGKKNAEAKKGGKKGGQPSAAVPSKDQHASHSKKLAISKNLALPVVPPSVAAAPHLLPHLMAANKGNAAAPAPVVLSSSHPSPVGSAPSALPSPMLHQSNNNNFRSFNGNELDYDSMENDDDDEVDDDEEEEDFDDSEEEERVGGAFLQNNHSSPHLPGGAQNSLPKYGNVSLDDDEEDDDLPTQFGGRVHGLSMEEDEEDDEEEENEMKRLENDASPLGVVPAPLNGGKLNLNEEKDFDESEEEEEKVKKAVGLVNDIYNDNREEFSKIGGPQEPSKLAGGGFGAPAPKLVGVNA